MFERCATVEIEDSEKQPQSDTSVSPSPYSRQGQCYRRNSHSRLPLQQTVTIRVHYILCDHDTSCTPTLRLGVVPEDSDAHLRPRRLILLLLTLPFLFFAFLYLSSPDRALSVFLSTSAPDETKLPDEIFGLLHFVTAPEEAGRVLRVAGEPQDDIGSTGDSGWDGSLSSGGATVVPAKPVEMAWYALGSIAKMQERGRGRGQGRSTGGGWEDRINMLREQHPLVVFSKVRTPLGSGDGGIELTD
ncbi:hypothetical protein PAXINDRAFT_97362, partial [Paxillus involutus ATCC 200175]